MAMNSNIEWTHHTFNPWVGCSKVSDGCKFCYAETLMDKRYGKVKWGPNGTRMVKKDWSEPRKWNKLAAAAGERHRVFCASLADIFEGPETMPESEWPKVCDARERLGLLIEATPHLDWLLLTKRPENAWRWGATGARWRDGWPSNVWLGTSVENQATADERIPHLLKVPAAVRFISLEPQIDEVSFLNADGDALRGGMKGDIHWLIQGGESGPGARRFDVLWAERMRDECKLGGIAYFLKQLGSNPFIGDASHPHGWPTENSPVDWDTGKIRLNDRKGGTMEEWPADLRIRQFPRPA